VVQSGITVISAAHVPDVYAEIQSHRDRLIGDTPFEVMVFDADSGALIDHFHDSIDAGSAPGRS
jgi:hypothetical protein